jgi:hypothetical protein
MRDDAGKRLPDYLLIGAQKSGTTSLAHYLGAHPDVFCVEREVHYFDRHLADGVDWYARHFARAPEGALLGEGTPEYMYEEAVPPRMAELVPGARLLVILRHPVDRAYSQFWHNRTRGHEHLEFEAAVAAEEERLRAASTQRERSRFAYLDRGRYLHQLERVCRSFSREQLHVLLLDDLRRDRGGALRRTFEFLGVAPLDVPVAAAVEKNRFIEYRSQRLRPIIRKLPGPVQRVAGRANVRYAEYPRLDPELRARLAEGFVDDNAALATWLGRDLAEWAA